MRKTSPAFTPSIGCFGSICVKSYQVEKEGTNQEGPSFISKMFNGKYMQKNEERVLIQKSVSMRLLVFNMEIKNCISTDV